MARQTRATLSLSSRADHPASSASSAASQVAGGSFLHDVSDHSRALATPPQPSTPLAQPATPPLSPKRLTGAPPSSHGRSAVKRARVAEECGTLSEALAALAEEEAAAARTIVQRYEALKADVREELARQALDRKLAVCAVR